MGIEGGTRKIINHDFVQGQANPPSCQKLQLPRLGKPRRGLQIFDNRVDFPVPVESGGRFYYCKTLFVREDFIFALIRESRETRK